MAKITKAKKDKAKKRKIAKAKIDELFSLAEFVEKDRKELAMRYAALAKKISLKMKIKIPQKFKRKLCKSCKAYLIPSYNCRVRLHKKKVIYYCFSCKNFTRIPYLKEIKKKRRKY